VQLPYRLQITGSILLGRRHADYFCEAAGASAGRIYSAPRLRGVGRGSDTRLASRLGEDSAFSWSGIPDLRFCPSPIAACKHADSSRSELTAICLESGIMPSSMKATTAATGIDDAHFIHLISISKRSTRCGPQSSCNVRRSSSRLGSSTEWSIAVRPRFTFQARPFIEEQQPRQ
jgi:hypothetical protein